MTRRPIVLLAMLAACVAAISAVVVGLAASGSTPEPSGLRDTGRHDAPPTTGTGYDGAPVSVPTAGRPAIVTFLFADCPAICPRAAQEISLALDQAGEAAQGLDVVAVSVDPEGDTPAKVRAFLARHDLIGRMDYIVGTRAQLVPIWKAWAVAAQPAGKPVSAHSARIALVDREGRQVGAYSAGIPVRVSDLAEQMRSLVDN